MDLTAVITCLNEFEKLKLLLFDTDQQVLFSHIPKPFLIDPNLAQQDNSRVGNEEKDQEILMSNNSFWKQQDSEEVQLTNVANALDNIKKKKELNIIDKRLITILGGGGAN